MTTSNSDSLSTSIRLISPYETDYHIRCGRGQSGLRVPEVLHARLPRTSSEDWRQAIKEGRIRVNGRQPAEEHLIREGEQITVYAPRVVEPAVPDEVRILDESPEYLVAYKPAPMPVHQGGRYCYNSLKMILEHEYGYRLNVIHRLDVVTSGLVLFGKTRDFTGYARNLFQEHRVGKAYLCRVSGLPEWNTHTCRLPVYRREGIRFGAGEGTLGKSAVTDFEVLETGHDISLIKARPLTGRTHQIRVHLQAMGHPIHDDALYGPFQPEEGTVNALNRPISLQHISLELNGGAYSWQVPPDLPDLEFSSYL